MPAPPAAPVPGRRERKRGQTLDRLAATAFALFEAQGFEAVTMEQVAAAADVAKGTLYNHFPLKEALLAHQFHAEIAQAMGEDLAASLSAPEGFASRLSAWLEASAHWCVGRRAYLPHYLRYRFLSLNPGDRAGDGSRSGMERLFEALIEAGQRDGELRAQLPPAHLAALLQHLYLGALMRWVALPAQDADGARLEREFAAIVELFVHGAGRARSGA